VQLATGSAFALAVGGQRLFVATTSDAPLLVYEDGALLGDQAAPDEEVGMAAFDAAPLSGDGSMQVDDAGHLWLADGTVWLFEDAQGIAGNTVEDASFGDSGLVRGAAYDPAGAKLLGADGGAGIAAWDAPLDAMGGSLPADWVLDGALGVRDLAVAGGRLHAVVAGDPFLRSWSNIGAVNMPAAADVTVTRANEDPVDLFLRGDVLVVTDSFQGGRILIWTDVKALVDDQAPDRVVGQGDLAGARQAILAADDRLFVRVADGFAVFADALGTPTLVATVDDQIENTRDMVLIECTADEECAGTCLNGLCR
jgi:hypothetical protein